MNITIRAGKTVYWCQGCGKVANKYYSLNTRKHKCCGVNECPHTKIQFYCKGCFKSFKKDSLRIINSYEKVNFLSQKHPNM